MHDLGEGAKMGEGARATVIQFPSNTQNLHVVIFLLLKFENKFDVVTILNLVPTLCQHCQLCVL